MNKQKIKYPKFLPFKKEGGYSNKAFTLGVKPKIGYLIFFIKNDKKHWFYN